MHNETFCSIYDTHFHKVLNKTSHETLANYNNQDTLVPGGNYGDFYTHVNYHTIRKALSLLLETGKKDFLIVETGCAAHGTKSTLLFDKIANAFDGSVFSVDLDKKSVDETNRLTSDKTKVVHSDSLYFLPTLTTPIDFLYLDSYDVDFLNPLDSAKHHLKEFNIIKHLLHKNSVVLIDDTPISPEWLDNGKYCPIYAQYKSNFDPNMCGKGSLVNLELEKMGATKVMHQYQTLWTL